MTIKDFTELETWQLARKLCQEVFGHIQKPDFSRDFALKDQINRSSGSVMDNIAEGFGRKGHKEFINFLLISNGSNSEVRSQLFRAFDRNYITQKELDYLIVQSEAIQAKTFAHINYLRNTDKQGYRNK